VLVAIITGLAGSTMAKIIWSLLRWKRNFKSWHQHVLYIIGCAVIIVFIAFFLDQTILGSGKTLMTRTLFTDEKYTSLYSAGFRTLGPILCFTTGASGGVFAPSLSAGAGIGSMLSGWLHLSAANTNVVILAGMAGFLTGVTRSPFTSAILVLEMTDRHNLIFHLMLASMVASIVAIIIDRHSLYDHLKIDYIHDLHHEGEEATP
jgi:H+/Cl- antiporter ClcA